jgi:hypothetical protein
MQRWIERDPVSLSVRFLWLLVCYYCMDQMWWLENIFTVTGTRTEWKTLVE